MFKRVLVANRGEIALRVIRCLREMDIESVVVCSEADKNSLPVMLATKKVCIGPAKSKDSYLNQDVILETAIKTGCDAIYPGYGFLSENADFAKKCEDNDIVFIGPSSKIISMMGDKQTARSLMIANEVPTVPGSKGIVSDYDEAAKVADSIGYPVLIKASAGGGGKGMRKAFYESELKHSYETAKAEARASFGNDAVYIEKLILNPHHIEVQILGDKFGNVVYLGDRDCSIQNNNQKMLEEAPAFMLNEKERRIMGDTAIRAAKAAGYYSAGTVEFVVDDDKNFYFIEMNTRIQVEHPVTESVTGIDLIREQIRISCGLKLDICQEDIRIRNHSIECRINALSTGSIDFLHFPAGYGVRVDSHIYTGYEITPFYDSMIAKIIVSGKTRLEAVKRMRRALEELIIDGVKTNSELMHLLMYHPMFVRGVYNTSFWEDNKDTIMKWLEEGIEGIEDK